MLCGAAVPLENTRPWGTHHPQPPLLVTQLGAQCFELGATVASGTFIIDGQGNHASFLEQFFKKT